MGVEARVEIVLRVLDGCSRFLRTRLGAPAVTDGRDVAAPNLAQGLPGHFHSIPSFLVLEHPDFLFPNMLT